MRAFSLVLLIATAAPVLGQDESPHPMDGAPADASRHLFQSDMTLMNGMVPIEPMAGMRMPWHLMDVGIATAGYDDQGGPSGGTEADSVNWNMLHSRGASARAFFPSC